MYIFHKKMIKEVMIDSILLGELLKFTKKPYHLQTLDCH